MIRLETPSQPIELKENSLAGLVELIEYKGMEVSLGLNIPGYKEFGVVIPEKEFFPLRLDLGTQLIASWSEEDTHILS